MILRLKKLSTQLLLLMICTGSIFGFNNIAKANTPAAPVCYLQINKSSAWAQYNLIVNMYDFTNQKLINTYTLPASGKDSGINTLKQSFDCEKYKIVSFGVIFSPPIWQNQTGKEYKGKLIYNLQTQLLNPSAAQTLTVAVNFPDDFVGIPAQVGNVD